jgi:excisionase family DNA binding protein
LDSILHEVTAHTTGKTDVTAGGEAFTVDEAHAFIGKDKISRGGFYAAIKRGEVPHLRLGQRILIPRHAFLRWLDQAGKV